MKSNLVKLQPNDIRLAPHTMELERIRFLITSYLRTRLMKIEKFAIHLLSQEGGENKLTDSEREYAQNYVNNMKSYYGSYCIFSSLKTYYIFYIQNLFIQVLQLWKKCLEICKTLI